jgi:hypothetical protein
LTITLTLTLTKVVSTLMGKRLALAGWFHEKVKLPELLESGGNDKTDDSSSAKSTESDRRDDREANGNPNLNTNPNMVEISNQRGLMASALKGMSYGDRRQR